MYRLSDNYIRFYLKYILKNRGKIEQGHFNSRPISSFSGWEIVMGLQFENLILNNRSYIYDQLGVSPADIISDNPYFQRKTANSRGCQIDYLIQTRYNNLFACEVKFSRQQINSDVIPAMQNKIAALKLPRGFSCWPVLIHVNGVASSVEDSGYFAQIIDFTKALQYK